MVFQNFNLFENMNVLKNCTIGQEKVLKVSKEEAEKKAKFYLEKVGMLPYINATISMTSPQNEKYIKKDDIVEYNITVKNTGEIQENILI